MVVGDASTGVRPCARARAAAGVSRRGSARVDRRMGAGCGRGLRSPTCGTPRRSTMRMCGDGYLERGTWGAEPEAEGRASCRGARTTGHWWPEARRRVWCRYAVGVCCPPVPVESPSTFRHVHGAGSVTGSRHLLERLTIGRRFDIRVLRGERRVRWMMCIVRVRHERCKRKGQSLCIHIQSTHGNALASSHYARTHTCYLFTSSRLRRRSPC